MALSFAGSILSVGAIVYEYRRTEIAWSIDLETALIVHKLFDSVRYEWAEVQGIHFSKTTRNSFIGVYDRITFYLPRGRSTHVTLMMDEKAEILLWLKENGLFSKIS
jgi:hypothetical protein